MYSSAISIVHYTGKKNKLKCGISLRGEERVGTLKSSSRAPRWKSPRPPGREEAHGGREDPITVEDGGGVSTTLAGAISRRPPRSSWASTEGTSQGRSSRQGCLPGRCSSGSCRLTRLLWMPTPLNRRLLCWDPAGI
jgi:hypothetical protein